MFVRALFRNCRCLVSNEMRARLGTVVVYFGAIPVFAYREWVKQQILSVRVAGYPVEARTRYLQNKQTSYLPFERTSSVGSCYI
jgi:hypothetical protein